LAPESVIHIPVDYYLSVHNSGKIYLQHHHWYYIYTYIHTVCMLSSVWARSCFWIGVSTPHQIFPHPLFLFTLYFIIIITIFTFILSKVAYIR
jgi:hypothetical protein